MHTHVSVLLKRACKMSFLCSLCHFFFEFMIYFIFTLLAWRARVSSGTYFATTPEFSLIWPTGPRAPRLAFRLGFVGSVWLPACDVSGFSSHTVLAAILEPPSVPRRGAALRWTQVSTSFMQYWVEGDALVCGPLGLPGVFLTCV